MAAHHIGRLTKVGMELRIRSILMHLMPPGVCRLGRPLAYTGNWHAFKIDAGDGQGGLADGDYGDAGDLVQDERSHNAANDTGCVSTTQATDWADLVYDANGNMATVPRPGDPASCAGPATFVRAVLGVFAAVWASAGGVRSERGPAR